jgi:hypothetical protein
MMNPLLGLWVQIVWLHDFKMDKAEDCHGFNVLRQRNKINGFRAISTLHVVRMITSKPYGYFYELHVILSWNFCKLMKFNQIAILSQLHTPLIAVKLPAFHGSQRLIIVFTRFLWIMLLNTIMNLQFHKRQGIFSQLRDHYLLKKGCIPYS